MRGDGMRIVIVGAGGQGRIVADILLASRAAGSATEPVAFVDDVCAPGEEIFGIPVAGPLSELASVDHDAVIVAIGDNAARRATTERLLASGESLGIACHPSVIVGAEVHIGAGSMLSAGAIITPRARLGTGVLLNTRSSVDHDSVLGDFVHVSAGAVVGARCHIGEETMISLGASVSSDRTVGARTIVGAGAVVVRDIPDDVVAYGVPARVMRDRRAATTSR
jgi:sugar O-acyltransferase (sialic acid O-acetyltransferase NeuD family)